MDSLGALAEAAHQRLGEYRSLWFEGRWYGSGELYERGRRVAGGLRKLGVAPGDRVVVYMANCPEVSVTYHALWRAGAVITPVIFLSTTPELRHAVLDSGAVAVITTVELAPRAMAAVEGLGVRLVVVGAGTAESIVDFAELEAAEPIELVRRTGDELAALMYTGGTTGRSKGVPLTHANLTAAGAASIAHSYVDGLDRGLVALPLSHAFGLLVTVGGLHRPVPSNTVLLRWFDAATWLDLAATHRVQVAAVVPSMVAMLLGQPLERYQLTDLAYLYSGAAPLSAAIREEFEKRVPGVQIVEGYGCTETAGLISSTPHGQRRNGTVGRPVPGVEVRIVDLDGTDAPTGVDGEILVRGPNVMAGYWRGAAQDAAESQTEGAAESPAERTADSPAEGAAVDGDGWFATGDIGNLDADGYLRIVDRKKDLIIRGGYNVYPRDVEDVLLQHDDVVSAAVVGRPDPRLGEEVVAFVAVRPGAAVTGADLIGFAQDRLAATKYPREVRVLDAIPLTSVGKVDRKRLREQASG